MKDEINKTIYFLVQQSNIMKKSKEDISKAQILSTLESLKKISKKKELYLAAEFG